MTKFDFPSIYGDELIEIKSIKPTKYGYVIREEVVDQTNLGSEIPLTLLTAYTNDGYYIGNPGIAKFICNQMGIKPELIHKNSRVCSIGFNEDEQRWYGWSHRAIFGFGIGSKIEDTDDVAYNPKNREEYLDYLIKGYENNPVYDNVKYDIDEDKSIITFNYTLKGRDVPLSMILPLETQYGNGFWEAKTLDDAKQMAIDFANNIS